MLVMNISRRIERTAEQKPKIPASLFLNATCNCIQCIGNINNGLYCLHISDSFFTTATSMNPWKANLLSYAKADLHQICLENLTIHRSKNNKGSPLEHRNHEFQITILNIYQGGPQCYVQKLCFENVLWYPVILLCFM